MNLITDFLDDEQGFIISAELVLVATIGVLGLVVGLSQVQNAVVSELNDVAHAIGALNQTYYVSGFSAWKWWGGLKSMKVGSAFYDFADACDGWGCAISCDAPVAECGIGWGGTCGGGGFGGGYGGYQRGGIVSGNCSPAVSTSCSDSCSASTCSPTPVPAEQGAPLQTP
jgi:hypothetical protein